MKDPLEERVQELPEHLLSNAVADCWNTQWARLAIALGDMDAAQGVGSERPVLELPHQGQLVLYEILLVQRNTDLINPRRAAITSHVAEGGVHDGRGNTPGQRVCFDLGHVTALSC